MVLASCTDPFALICRLFSLWGPAINSSKRQLKAAGAVLSGQDKPPEGHVDTLRAAFGVRELQSGLIEELQLLI